MSAGTAIARGRAAAEALMTDACTITRAGAGRTFNTTTGAYTDDAASIIYRGRCRVKPSILSADTTAQAADRQVSLWPYAVSVPVTVGAELGDKVTITASADPALVGADLRIRSVARGTYLTARRLDCEDYQ